MSVDGTKNPARQAGGYKAAINNPNVSEEAKDRARDALENLDVPCKRIASCLRVPMLTNAAQSEKDAAAGKDPHRQAGGYKATLKNPNVSEEAKMHAKERLGELEDGTAQGWCHLRCFRVTLIVPRIGDNYDGSRISSHAEHIKLTMT